MLVQADPRRPQSAHVVVLGNEKGGSGKSTTAMHIAVALMNAGQRVATIDLNSRQKTFTHYVENRRAWAARARHRARTCRRISASRAAKALRSRERGERVCQLRRRASTSRARPRLRRDRYAGHRHLSDAARAFDGRHAGYAAQRQFRRFRRARHRRSGELRGHRRKPLRRNGARCAPPAASASTARLIDWIVVRNRLVAARLAQQAAGRRGPRPISARLGFRCCRRLCRARRSFASSSRAG